MGPPSEFDKARQENGRRSKMTVHTAAFQILNEVGRPLKSREIAAIALDRGLVVSAARDPITSLSTTIDKTIRDRVYNQPELVFIDAADGRRIGLPRWKPVELKRPQRTEPKVPVQIPASLMEQVRLATQARIASSFDETVAVLLAKGLAAARSDISNAIKRQLANLGNADA